MYRNKTDKNKNDDDDDDMIIRYSSSGRPPCWNSGIYLLLLFKTFVYLFIFRQLFRNRN